MLNLFVISIILFVYIAPKLGDGSDRVGPSCNHYFGQPITNKCINQNISNFAHSYKQQCTDENTMVEMFYQGLDCNDSRLAYNRTEECHGYDCYCGALTNECEIADVTVTYCNSTEIPDQHDFQFVIDECLADVDNRSHILGCQQGQFYRLAYNTTDCSGDEYIQMNFPQDCQTESPFQVGVICTTNYTEPQPATTEEIEQDCNFYQGSAVNECMSDSNNSDLYIKYNCVDERTISIKYYADSECNESKLTQSEERECTFANACYCGALNNQCDVADVSWVNCSSPVDTANYKLVVNQCLYIDVDFSYNISYQFRCTENGGMNVEYYFGKGCSGTQLLSFDYPHSCENATDGFIISCIERGQSITTEEPTTTTASRLCESEHILQEYNNCGIFRYNGGCKEHNDDGALVFQNKSGEMSYAECCAKCNEMNDCKSFSFGKSGVTSQNWCNIYSLECSDNGNKDWFMFTPINNVDAICNIMV